MTVQIKGCVHTGRRIQVNRSPKRPASSSTMRLRNGEPAISWRSSSTESANEHTAASHLPFVRCLSPFCELCPGSRQPAWSLALKADGGSPLPLQPVELIGRCFLEGCDDFIRLPAQPRTE